MMQRVKRRKEDCKIQRSWIRQHVSSYPANIQLQYQDECIFINILCMLCMGLTLKWATSNHPTLSIYNSNLIIASLCHRADGTVFPLQRMFTFSAAKPTTPFCSAACHHIIRCSGSDDSKPSNRCATADLSLFVFAGARVVLGKFLISQLQELLL